MFRAQGHKGINPFFARINTLVLKHFTIGLLSKLRQQVKYEQMKMFDEVVEVVEKEAWKKFHNQL